MINAQTTKAHCSYNVISKVQKVVATVLLEKCRYGVHIFMNCPFLSLKYMQGYHSLPELAPTIAS